MPVVGRSRGVQKPTFPWGWVRLRTLKGYRCVKMEALGAASWRGVICMKPIHGLNDLPM